MTAPGLLFGAQGPQSGPQHKCRSARGLGQSGRVASDEFTWGDDVLVIGPGERWRHASVCSPAADSPSGLALVEYEDGSSEEVSPERLRRRTDDQCWCAELPDHFPGETITSDVRL